MKRILTAFVFLFSASVLGSNQASVQTEAPHLDLEMTGPELRLLLSRQPSIFAATPSVGRLDQIIAFGKRNLDWLSQINRARSVPLSFTNPSTTKGIPIEAPKEYSDETIWTSYLEILTQLPDPMKRVLVDNEPLTDTPGIPDSEYIEWGRKSDVIYQTAARWILLSPWMKHLTENKKRDVRGHYFLTKEVHLDQNLRNFSSLPVDLKSKYSEWLVANCMNQAQDETHCRAELAAAETSSIADPIVDFYNRYKKAAEDNWNSFFRIPKGVRFPGLEWTSANPDIAIVPFVDPIHQAYRDFLSVNIEAEWAWLPWKLKVDFNSSSANKVNVQWKPGITPHVLGLGSGEVFMDSNAPLTEYGVQWTIRHEFGHVVGIPDCYLEFYDPARKLIVSYQHDTTDLMCSRAGSLNQKHVDELRRVYFH